MGKTLQVSPVVVADGVQPSSRLGRNSAQVAAGTQAGVSTHATSSENLASGPTHSSFVASSGDGLGQPTSIEDGAGSGLLAKGSGSQTAQSQDCFADMQKIAEGLRLRERTLRLQEQRLAQRALSDEQRFKRLGDSLNTAQGFAFSQRGPRLKEPEAFSTSSADRTVGDFLAEIERYLRLSNADPDMYVEYASAYLAGEASRFWEATVASASTQGAGLTWMDFKERLTQAFDVVDQDSAARAELYALEMSAKEGVESYYRKFVALLARMREKPTVPDQVYHFRKGLTSHLWRVTACDAGNHMRPFTSFKLLVRCALAHGKSMGGKHKDKSDMPKMASNKEGEGADHILPKRKRAMEGLVGGGSSDAGLYADSRQCYNCKGYGHVNTSCPSVRATKGSQDGKGSAKLQVHALHVAEQGASHSDECVCDDCDRDRVMQLRLMRRGECNARKQAARQRGLATS